MFLPMCSDVWKSVCWRVTFSLGFFQCALLDRIDWIPEAVISFSKSSLKRACGKLVYKTVICASKVLPICCSIITGEMVFLSNFFQKFHLFISMNLHLRFILSFTTSLRTPPLPQKYE